MALKDLGVREMTAEELERINRDEEDERWWNENVSDISEKYKGNYIAVVNKQALVGETYQEAYKKAKKKYPDREPLVEYIPFKREIWVL